MLNTLIAPSSMVTLAFCPEGGSLTASTERLMRLSVLLKAESAGSDVRSAMAKIVDVVYGPG